MELSIHFSSVLKLYEANTIFYIVVKEIEEASRQYRKN